jgi:hypothetical protein
MVLFVCSMTSLKRNSLFQPSEIVVIQMLNRRGTRGVGAMAACNIWVIHASYRQLNCRHAQKLLKTGSPQHVEAERI